MDEFLQLKEKDINKYIGLCANNRRVICLTTSVIYPSISKASIEAKISKQSINRSCNGVRPMVKSKVTNKVTRWMYYDDYVKLEDKK